jgi:hypothetical protein
MIDGGLKRLCEMTLDDLPRIRVVVQERLVSRLNSDSHSDESGKVSCLGSHLISDSLEVVSIGVSLIEN